MYIDGGQPDMMVVSPTNKVVFSDLNSGSAVTNQQHMTSPKDATIIGSVSMYLTDFGMLNVTIDRFTRTIASSCWIPITTRSGIFLAACSRLAM